jgi:hypothetical protein
MQSCRDVQLNVSTKIKKLFVLEYFLLAPKLFYPPSFPPERVAGWLAGLGSVDVCGFTSFFPLEQSFNC